MFRRDYLLKQLDKLAALVERMLQKKREEQHDAAIEEAELVLDEVFSSTKQLIKYADSATLSTVIGEAELVRSVARVTKTEAEIYEAKGDAAMAAQKYRRALELFIEGNERGASDKEIAALKARVDTKTLDERYRAKL